MPDYSNIGLVFQLRVQGQETLKTVASQIGKLESEIESKLRKPLRAAVQPINKSLMEKRGKLPILSGTDIAKQRMGKVGPALTKGVITKAGIQTNKGEDYYRALPKDAADVLARLEKAGSLKGSVPNISGLTSAFKDASESIKANYPDIAKVFEDYGNKLGELTIQQKAYSEARKQLLSEEKAFSTQLLSEEKAFSTTYATFMKKKANDEIRARDGLSKFKQKEEQKNAKIQFAKERPWVREETVRSVQSQYDKYVSAIRKAEDALSKFEQSIADKNFKNSLKIQQANEQLQEQLATRRLKTILKDKEKQDKLADAMKHPDVEEATPARIRAAYRRHQELEQARAEPWNEPETPSSIRRKARIQARIAEKALKEQQAAKDKLLSKTKADQDKLKKHQEGPAVFQTPETNQAMKLLQSSAQGVMLGMSLLRGNVVGTAFSIIFMGKSIIDLNIAVAASVVLLGKYYEAVSYLATNIVTAGVAIENFGSRMAVLTNSSSRITKANAEIDKSVQRYGFTYAEVSDMIITRQEMQLQTGRRLIATNAQIAAYASVMGRSVAQAYSEFAAAGPRAARMLIVARRELRKPIEEMSTEQLVQKIFSPLNEAWNMFGKEAVAALRIVLVPLARVSEGLMKFITMIKENAIASKVAFYGLVSVIVLTGLAIVTFTMQLLAMAAAIPAVAASLALLAKSFATVAATTGTGIFGAIASQALSTAIVLPKLASGFAMAAGGIGGFLGIAVSVVAILAAIGTSLDLTSLFAQKSAKDWIWYTKVISDLGMLISLILIPLFPVLGIAVFGASAAVRVASEAFGHSPGLTQTLEDLVKNINGQTIPAMNKLANRTLPNLGKQAADAKDKLGYSPGLGDTLQTMSTEIDRKYDPALQRYGQEIDNTKAKSMGLTNAIRLFASRAGIKLPDWFANIKIPDWLTNFSLDNLSFEGLKKTWDTAWSGIQWPTWITEPIAFASNIFSGISTWWTQTLDDLTKWWTDLWANIKIPEIKFPDWKTLLAPLQKAWDDAFAKLGVPDWAKKLAEFIISPSIGTAQALVASLANIKTAQTEIDLTKKKIQEFQAAMDALKLDKTGTITINTVYTTSGSSGGNNGGGSGGTGGGTPPPGNAGWSPIGGGGWIMPEANGGIVRYPSILVGEGNKAEAIVPLTDRKRSLEVLQEAAKAAPYMKGLMLKASGVRGMANGGVAGQVIGVASGDSGGVTIQLNITGNYIINDRDVADLADKVVEQIGKQMRIFRPYSAAA